jgi:hypothetical protein
VPSDSDADLLDANEMKWAFSFVGHVGSASKSLVRTLMKLVDDDG